MRNPFVVGSWVRGERFYGRAALLQEVLHGERKDVWVIGTRRVGKTSFLKQLEWLCLENGGERQMVPLFWDLEGSRTLAGLHESLLESVEAASSRFEALGVPISEIEDLDLFGALRLLKRRARDTDRRLLLLCDECEELLHIEQDAAETLPRLRRLLQEGEHLRTVLVATKRLGDLESNARSDTSPFLHGFVPPLYLSRLDEAEATALVGQGGFDDATVREIQMKTDNHPYLLQMVCKKLFDSQDLGSVLEEIQSDDLVSHFFSVDFAGLAAPEKEILLHVARSGGASSIDLQAVLGATAAQVASLLQGLRHLGYLKQTGRLCVIASSFFESWLCRAHGLETSPSLGSAASGVSFDAESTMELLRRARDGDGGARLHLVDRYETAFQRWLEARLPHRLRNRIDAGALLRRTIENAIEELDPEREGELWDHLRTQLLEGLRQGVAAASVRPPTETHSLAMDSAACPQEEVVGSDTLDRYERALGRLRSEERQAIVTRIEMGCTYEQVAESLGKPSVGAARMAVCRALVRLAREMST